MTSEQIQQERAIEALVAWIAAIAGAIDEAAESEALDAPEAA